MGMSSYEKRSIEKEVSKSHKRTCRLGGHAPRGGAQTAISLQKRGRGGPESALLLDDAHALDRLVRLGRIAFDVRAPWLGFHRAGRLPDHVELAVGLDLADEHRLVQVVVLLVHLRQDARRRLEGLAGHGGNHLVGVGRFGFFNRLLPHVDADIGRFHRVVGQRLVLVAGDALGLGVVAPLLDELGVGRILDRHEVVPGSQVADQRFRVHAAQFLFTHAERHDRHVLGLQAGIAQFLVERHVRVAVDGRDHRRLAALRELLHVGHDGLVVRMAERRVFFVDVLVGHALRFEVGAQDFVGGARVHVVSAQQHPALGATAGLAHQIIDGRNRLLVRRRAGVEHVLAQLFTLVLHRVEQQAVHFLDHRQHRLARHRSPAAEDDGNLVLAEQLLGLFGEQRPVRGRIDDDGFELLAHHAALGIDLVNRHQDGVFQHGLGNRHGARQAVQDADLDGVFGRIRGQRGQGGQGDGGGERLEGESTLHECFSGMG